MQGWQLTFFTRQDRMHGTLSLAEGLIAEAKKLGVSGARSWEQPGLVMGGTAKYMPHTFSSLPNNLCK